jgi:ankyrin repeat protein
VSEHTSEILTLLRSDDREAAEKLARMLPALDIFEASALGALEHLIERAEEDASSVNSYSDHGWTPLYLAAAYGNAACMKELLRRGARVHEISKNERLRTALDVALQHGDADIVRILRTAGDGGHTPT